MVIVMPASPVPQTAPVAPVADPDLAVAAARARTSEALVRVARLLDEVADTQARSARAVRATWEGPHRSRFDAERAGRDGDLAGLASACRLLAGR